MLTSLTPSARSVARSSSATRGPARRVRRSGSVTISTSGVPPRLKSTTLRSEPWMRPLAPRWISLAASSSRCTRWMRTSAERAAAAQRLVVLGDLVALRQVGVEVVLAVEDRARRELAAEREPDHQAEVDRARVDDRQRARAGRGRPGRCACSAGRRSDSSQPQNIFVARRELDVDLQADDRLELGSSAPRAASAAVEAERLLERVGGLEQRVLAEGRAGELEADRQRRPPPGGSRGRRGSRSPGSRRATSAPCRSR